MDKLIGRLAENELIVDTGSSVYVFRPLSGEFEATNKRKLKIRFFLYWRGKWKSCITMV